MSPELGGFHPDAVERFSGEISPEQRVRKPEAHLNYLRGIIRKGEFDPAETLDATTELDIVQLEEDAKAWVDTRLPAGSSDYFEGLREQFSAAFGLMARVEQKTSDVDERFATLLDLDPDRRDFIFRRFYREIVEIRDTAKRFDPQPLRIVVAYALLRGSGHLESGMKRAKRQNRIPKVLKQEFDPARRLMDALESTPSD